MAFSQDLIGRQFGNYRLIRRIGVGGFASVYLGQHVRLPTKQAAIKILDLREVDQQQFQQEAETTERLIHPNIVRLLDFDVQQGRPFLVLDYAPGGSVRTRHPKGSQVPLATVVEYLNEIVSALQYAHDQHILHCDIKPDNILIGRQGELLLSDFGIALLSRTGRTSLQGPTITGGTPSYMAPEQFRGKTGKASDQYALAIVVYEWLCGTVPFTKGGWMERGYQHNHEPVPSLRASVPALPATAEAVVMKALAKQPQDRFPSVQAFAQALEAAYQQPVILPPTVPTSSQHSASSKAHRSIRNQSTKSAQTIRRGRALNIRILFILALVLIVVLSGGSLYHFWSIVPSPTPPVMLGFGFDAARTHNNPYEHTLSSSNVSQLKLLWTFATGDQIYSSPTVAGGIVYVGSHDGNLYAFDASCRNNCQPLWSFPTRDWIKSSPAVANGTVYVGSDDGNLYAFDASCHNACKPLWSFPTGESIVTSPAVANGTVYVGSGDHKLYAFDASCRNACKPLWSFPTGDWIDSSPAVANGIVYIGSDDGKLYAFDASCLNTCYPLWRFPTGNSIYSSPSVAGGIVYIGSDDGNLYAFDASCLNACKPLWSFATGKPIQSSPAIANGMVYVGTDDGNLYAFDASCRNACLPLWSFTTGGPVESSPAIAGGIVYIGSNDHNLYAFDASCRHACKPLWSFLTGDAISSSPTVANGKIYVGSNDHKLYAFGLVA